jgi:hypothetical protein
MSLKLRRKKGLALRLISVNVGNSVDPIF